VERISYKTEYESLSFYYIGGRWGYAVMKIVDSNDEYKIRLSKCRKKSGFPETDKFKWVEVDPENIDNLSQVNHINFKNVDAMEACYEKLVKEFEDLDSMLIK
jgi:hypothetical protein